MRKERSIRRYMRRMMSQAVIKWANAPEGGSWELVHVVEHGNRTEIHMETRYPMRELGIESLDMAYHAVKIVVHDMGEKIEPLEYPGVE